MIDTLDELHRATLMNSRASALYEPLRLQGEKLCVCVWDSYPIKIQKPQNHRNQRASWSTKHHGNSLSRLEMCDLEGRPVFTLPVSASTSPRATDESMAFFILDLESVVQQQGGLTAMLVGRPGYRMVHLLDNGFRYIIRLTNNYAISSFCFR